MTAAFLRIRSWDNLSVGFKFAVERAAISGEKEKEKGLWGVNEKSIDTFPERVFFFGKLLYLRSYSRKHRKICRTSVLLTWKSTGSVLEWNR